MKFTKNLKFLWKYGKDQKKNLIILIVSYVFSIVFKIINPILSSKIIISFTKNEINQIIYIAIAILFTDIIANFVYYVIRNKYTIIARTISTNVSIDLGENILKIESESLEKHGTGVFIQRISSDTEKLTNAFNSLIEMAAQILTFIGTLTAIFIVNWIVFLFLIVVIIFKFIIESKRTSVFSQSDKETRKMFEKLSNFVAEVIRGANDIKLLFIENNVKKEITNRINEVNDKYISMRNKNMNYRLVTWQVSDIFEFLLIVLLAILLKNNIVQAVSALILYNYSKNVSNSSYWLGNILEVIKDFNLSSERINEIINSDDFKKEKFGNKHINKVNGNFEFKNVTFGYNDRFILKDLSFKINANETVAFVGKTGSGKTTIFNLLSKLYTVNDGTITIDGININELDKESIRGNITIISQNPYIFNMTIKENLKLVKPDLTDEEMIKACKKACLDEFIDSLSDRYDTLIGEDGVNLSGGEKQRLAIARALIQDTEIILFDEATSSLDNETQEKIQKAIENMKNRYTILIIAHRLSTIKNVDRILYLDDGKIVDEGTHKDLLKKSDKYKSLYQSDINKEQ